MINVETRKVPMKNYIIFAIMTIVVILVVLYTANYYSLSRDFYLDNSYVNNIIPNIDEASFESFVNETPEVVVYIADSKDATLKNFEKKFRRLIINHNIKENFIYLDSSKIDGDSFYNTFPKYYSSDLRVSSLELVIPNLFYFENGKITKILYLNSNDEINISDVQSFLIECEVIDVD